LFQISLQKPHMHFFALSYLPHAPTETPGFQQLNNI
jgi:hypothetical protein